MSIPVLPGRSDGPEIRRPVVRDRGAERACRIMEAAGCFYLGE